MFAAASTCWRSRRSWTDLTGLRRLMSLLGPEFDLVVSDQTGVFPGEPGVGERLGFIYR